MKVTCGQGMVTHTRNLCSAFTPSKCAHTHTHTHTPEQWAANAAAPGEQLGFGALLKDTSVVVLKVERALYIHSPTNNPAGRDSNLQPLDYKSDSLTIRPRLPLPEYFLIMSSSDLVRIVMFCCCVFWLLLFFW